MIENGLKKGSYQANEGERLTSNNHGFKLLSTKMSNPYNSEIENLETTSHMLNGPTQHRLKKEIRTKKGNKNRKAKE